MLPSAQTYTCIFRFIAKIVYTSLLPLLSCVVWHCRTWREALSQCGTAALKPWHCHDLSDRWGWGGIYTHPLPPQWISSSFCSFQLIQNKKGALSLPPLVTLSPQANLLISPSILEWKGSKTWLKSSSIDSSTQKSTWFTFWSAVVSVTLGALLLDG